MNGERQGKGQNSPYPTRGEEKNKGQPDQTAAHSGGKLQTVRARYLYGQGLHRRRPLYNGGDMPKVQLYLRAFLQLPYALFHSLRQSQLNQMLSKSGSGQGYGGGRGTLGKQPFRTLVFVLRHHAPVRAWARRRCAGSPLRTEYGQSAYTATACTI